MDLDDDELWSTQYANRYVKKSKIIKKKQEVEEAFQDYQKANVEVDEKYMYYMAQIEILNEILEG